MYIHVPASPLSFFSATLKGYTCNKEDARFALQNSHVLGSTMDPLSEALCRSGLSSPGTTGYPFWGRFALRSENTKKNFRRFIHTRSKMHTYGGSPFRTIYVQARSHPPEPMDPPFVDRALHAPIREYQRITSCFALSIATRFYIGLQLILLLSKERYTLIY